MTEKTMNKKASTNRELEENTKQKMAVELHNKEIIAFISLIKSVHVYATS